MPVAESSWIVLVVGENNPANGVPSGPLRFFTTSTLVSPTTAPSLSAILATRPLSDVLASTRRALPKSPLRMASTTSARRGTLRCTTASVGKLRPDNSFSASKFFCAVAFRLGSVIVAKMAACFGLSLDSAGIGVAALRLGGALAAALGLTAALRLGGALAAALATGGALAADVVDSNEVRSPPVPSRARITLPAAVATPGTSASGVPSVSVLGVPVGPRRPPLERVLLPPGLTSPRRKESPNSSTRALSSASFATCRALPVAGSLANWAIGALEFAPTVFAYSTSWSRTVGSLKSLSSTRVCTGAVVGMLNPASVLASSFRGLAFLGTGGSVRGARRTSSGMRASMGLSCRGPSAVGVPVTEGSAVGRVASNTSIACSIVVRSSKLGAMLVTPASSSAWEN